MLRTLPEEGRVGCFKAREKEVRNYGRNYRKPSLEVAPNTLATFQPTMVNSWLTVTYIYRYKFRSAFQPRSAIAAVAERLFPPVIVTSTFEIDLDSVKVKGHYISLES